MRPTKQDIELLLQRLPDDVSIKDIQYHLHVLDKIRRGVEDARVNGTLSQEEVLASAVRILDRVGRGNPPIQGVSFRPKSAAKKKE